MGVLPNMPVLIARAEKVPRKEVRTDFSYGVSALSGAKGPSVPDLKILIFTRLTEKFHKFALASKTVVESAVNEIRSIQSLIF